MKLQQVSTVRSGNEEGAQEHTKLQRLGTVRSGKEEGVREHMKPQRLGKEAVSSGSPRAREARIGSGGVGSVVPARLPPQQRLVRTYFVARGLIDPRLANPRRFRARDCPQADSHSCGLRLRDYMLAKFLHDRDTGMCGTVKKNRKGMPELKSKLDRDEIEVAHTDAWLELKWLDKKEVYMITTVHETGYSSTGKQHWKTKEDIMCDVEFIKKN